MMDEKLQAAINDQIQKELYSGYLYLAMSAYCEAEGWPGFAHWMRAQAEEEQGHAMRLFHFVNRRGGRVLLQPIEQPPTEFGTPLEVFRAVYEHEQKVTASIHRLYELADEVNDHAARIELQWFITEQVEEEEGARTLVDLLEKIGGHVNGLIMLDRQLAER
ncbi:MAG: ferritin [Anaerolineae bacterium]